VLSCPVCAVLFALVVCVVVSSLGHSFTKSHMLLVMTLVALLGSPGGQCPYKWWIWDSTVCKHVSLPPHMWCEHTMIMLWISLCNAICLVGSWQYKLDSSIFRLCCTCLGESWLSCTGVPTELVVMHWCALKVNSLVSSLCSSLVMGSYLDSVS